MKHLAAAALALIGTTGASAETPVSFDAYLAEMDRTPVSFVGNIFFNQSSPSGFVFLREGESHLYGAIIDAGRDKRERIETGCTHSNWDVQRHHTCAIAGTGSVEIRGSQIYLSIDTVTRLDPPQD